MKVLTRKDLRNLDISGWFSAWTQMMVEADHILEGNGHAFIDAYSWWDENHFLQAQTELLRLKVCKEAREAVRAAATRIIDEVLS